MAGQVVIEDHDIERGGGIGERFNRALPFGDAGDPNVGADEAEGLLQKHHIVCITVSYQQVGEGHFVEGKKGLCGDASITEAVTFRKSQKGGWKKVTAYKLQSFQLHCALAADVLSAEPKERNMASNSVPPKIGR